MLFIQFVLMIVTVCRVPTLQYNGTPLLSRLTSRDRRARRNFMRLSVTLTTYSLISWIPELMLSFVWRSGDSTVQAQQSVPITSDLFMCHCQYPTAIDIVYPDHNPPSLWFRIFANRSRTRSYQTVEEGWFFITLNSKGHLSQDIDTKFNELESKTTFWQNVYLP